MSRLGPVNGQTTNRKKDNFKMGLVSVSDPAFLWENSDPPDNLVHKHTLNHLAKLTNR